MVFLLVLLPFVLALVLGIPLTIACMAAHEFESDAATAAGPVSASARGRADRHKLWLGLYIGAMSAATLGLIATPIYYLITDHNRVTEPYHNWLYVYLHYSPLWLAAGALAGAWVVRALARRAAL
jgi:hypothetical protein